MAQNIVSATMTVTPKAQNVFGCELKVESHSHRHQNPAHRNAMIHEVYLAQLAGSHTVSNWKITDRYGVDQTALWMRRSEQGEEGFRGYQEFDTGGQIPQVGVVWGAFTGIYDDQCSRDSNCDSMRLQTYLPKPLVISVFNYLRGPVTFAFDISPAPSHTVKLVLGHVGGNGGNPAQRWAVLPDENFFVQV